MSDWTSYRVRDFLLFSKDTLLEVYEAYNYDYWPWQIVSLLLNAILIAIILKPGRVRTRLLFGYLAFIWVWVGAIFHLRYFEPINWAASYFAYVFFAEAFLMLTFGCLLGKVSLSSHPSKLWVLVLFVMATWIPIEVFFGRTITEVLPFGWGAERTVFGTLLLTFLFRPKKIAALLAFIPFIWTVLNILVWNSLR